MEAVRHPSNTSSLAAPDGWDEQADGECLDLPITDAGGTMFSFWRPSMAERLRILFGGHIRLGVFGRAHPPVSLDTN